jgi:hypothetical protein
MGSEVDKSRNSKSSSRERQRGDFAIVAAWKSMITPCRWENQGREGTEDGGQRARGTMGCAGKATSSYPAACMHPTTEDSDIVGLSQTDHLIYSGRQNEWSAVLRVMHAISRRKSMAKQSILWKPTRDIW